MMQRPRRPFPASAPAGKPGRSSIDASRTLAGYVGGLLATSALAGGACYLLLWSFGVPFRGVLALWVGFADLIPLVGATLGAVPADRPSPSCTRHRAGIAVLIFFIVYQQFENHVLQVASCARP